MEKFSHIDDIQRRIFAAMLAQLDDGVGQVLDAVKKEGILENRMIVFSATTEVQLANSRAATFPCAVEKEISKAESASPF